MISYDDYLNVQIEKFEDEICCEPKPIGTHLEPTDGTISKEPIYNCESCEKRECEQWQNYNEPTKSELEGEMRQEKLEKF